MQFYCHRDLCTGHRNDITIRSGGISEQLIIIIMKLLYWNWKSCWRKNIQFVFFLNFFYFLFIIFLNFKITNSFRKQIRKEYLQLIQPQIVHLIFDIPALITKIQRQKLCMFPNFLPNSMLHALADSSPSLKFLPWNSLPTLFAYSSTLDG